MASHIKLDLVDKSQEELNVIVAVMKKQRRVIRGLLTRKLNAILALYMHEEEEFKTWTGRRD